MSPQTIDCPASETIDTPQADETARMRYDRIVRARRDIRAGRYDNDAEIDRMLDACLGRIANDAHAA